MSENKLVIIGLGMMLLSFTSTNAAVIQVRGVLERDGISQLPLAQAVPWTLTIPLEFADYDPSPAIADPAVFWKNEIAFLGSTLTVNGFYYTFDAIISIHSELGGETGLRLTGGGPTGALYTGSLSTFLFWRNFSFEPYPTDLLDYLSRLPSGSIQFLDAELRLSAGTETNVSGIGPSLSWVSIPEPSSAVTCVLILGLWRRNRQAPTFTS